MPKLDIEFTLQVELNDTADPANFTAEALDHIRDSLAAKPGVIEVGVSSALVNPS